MVVAFAGTPVLVSSGTTLLKASGGLVDWYDAATGGIFAEHRGRSDGGLDNDLWCEGHGRRSMLTGHSFPLIIDRAFTTALSVANSSTPTGLARTFLRACSRTLEKQTEGAGARPPPSRLGLHATHAIMPATSGQGTEGPSPRRWSAARPGRPGPGASK